MRKVLLTGYSGFVGSALLKCLAGYQVTLIGRHPVLDSNLCFHAVDFESSFNCSKVLSDIDIVIHCAARAYIMNDKSVNPLNSYRAINLGATLRLANQAAQAGVKRFIFLSSIKVNGEETQQGESFTEELISSPSDFYGLSKHEAELGLLTIAQESNMEVVIIRPPLVYGPGIKANFASILNLVKKGYYLPLGSIVGNKRSLIALENLISFILLCADYEKTPQAANQAFVISDGEDLSTAELFKRIAKAYGKKSRLFPFPVFLLKLGATLLGRQGLANRLLGSLQVDSSKARELLNWVPVTTVDEQLRKIAIADGFGDDSVSPEKKYRVS